MPDTHLFSATLLAIISCAGSNIAQYIVLSLVASYSGVLLAQPLLPSARMYKLEEVMEETAGLLQKAIEERVLSNREFILKMHLKLARANLTKSTLRSEILGFESRRVQEYLHILGVLSHAIDRCRREVKEIKVAILAETESERQLLYNEEIIILSSGVIRSSGAILSSGFSASARQRSPVQN